MINDLPTRPQRQWYRISSYEITEAIKTTTNTSAPGYSNISWKHLKMLLRDDEFLTAITTLFNDILDEGQWPSEFKIANTVVIPKPKREDYSKPKIFRPIALLDCVGKLLSKVLASRLQDEALKYDLLHPLQFGGIKQRSTTDAGIVLTEFVKRARDNGHFTSCLAIDMAQYFPSLNHQVLNTMLLKLGFAPNIINLFSSYFEHRVTIYLWGNQSSPQFSASDGVPQGDPLSPILSDLYVAVPLCVYFPLSKNITKNILSFIDDYILVIVSISLALNIEQLTSFYRLFYSIVEGCDFSETDLEIFRIFLRSRNEFRYAHSKYVNKAFSALNAMRMLGNSIDGFTPSKRKLVFSSCVWSIVTYGSVLWYKRNGKGVKQKANKLNKVKNMRWISGAFSMTPIIALEVITGIPPILAQMNIIAFKYSLRLNKLSSIHPCRRLARSFQFQTINTKRIQIKPAPYERYSIFNMCRDPLLFTDEKFIYNHEEQIRGTRILDVYSHNVRFINFDHPKKGSHLFVQWFQNFQTWLNTIRNERDHLIIATDGGFSGTYGTAAFALWANHILINSGSSQVSAHSAFDAEIQAINLAFNHLRLLPFKRVTILIDNEAAAKAVWNTDYHNLQQTSLTAMSKFRSWIKRLKSKEFVVNVSWCPAHMDILENEVVDSLTTEVNIKDSVQKTTLESEVRKAKLMEYGKWDSATRKHNALGHEYPRLKFKGKRIGPALGSRKNAFIVVSKDNIKTMTRLTRIVTNHAPTGEYRRRFFPREPQNCRFDNEFHSRAHILVKCSNYEKRFKSLFDLCR
ncbi:hypothetical protein AX15_003772 [Amanita polypyramis BW_CC]|nr:hypothetical protein AX15_003772 [Amanita polypyramis BW_CC]